MLAQEGLFTKNGKIPLRYEELSLCLQKLRKLALELNASVHMNLIGSGQARGDWKVIEGLIYSDLVHQNVGVNIYLFGHIKEEQLKVSKSLTLFNEKSTWQEEK